MPDSSTSKKIQRVQRAGVTRVRGQRRALGFPIAVVAILVAGTLLVVLARSAKQNAVAAAPVANQDHWHNAFGVFICDQFLPNQPDAPNNQDPLGIHTHIQDGLIHIHPFVQASSGSNATFGKFLDQIQIEVRPGFFKLQDGTEHKDGDKCKKKDDKGAETEVEGKVKLFVWPPQANENTKPTVHTDGFKNLRFTQPHESYVLALVPDGVTPPLPPNVKDLENPSDSGAPAPADTGPDASTPGTVPEVTLPGSVPNNSAPPASAPAGTEPATSSASSAG